MQIVCPNCRTAYGVTPTALGAEGRNVRCAKCKEVWLARPEEAIVPEPVDADAGGTEYAPTAATAEGWSEADAPNVDSPSIAPGAASNDWSADGAPSEAAEDETPRARRWRPPSLAAPRPPQTLSIAMAAMAAMIAGLIIWRTDIVRLMPQTAGFYKLAGININLRNLAFENVRVSTETVNGAPVTVIEGAVVGLSIKPVEVPRLRFVVRDAQGTAVYAWNAVLEQGFVNPGDKVMFKSRLASPPPNAHELVVRFFNKRDVATGGV